MKFILAILLIVALIYSSPIASCESQSNCLVTTISNCNARGKRQVCIKWQGGGHCPKAEGRSGTGEYVSYVCPVYSTRNRRRNIKTENWPALTNICMNVTGGQYAKFAIKDGSICSQSGIYNFASLPPLNSSDPLSEAICYGPGCYCKGGNNRACLWKIPTDDCDEEPTCPSSLVCNVKMPCFGSYNGKQCPCTEYKFIK